MPQFTIIHVCIHTLNVFTATDRGAHSIGCSISCRRIFSMEWNRSRVHTCIHTLTASLWIWFCWGELYFLLVSSRKPPHYHVTCILLWPTPGVIYQNMRKTQCLAFPCTENCASADPFYGPFLGRSLNWLAFVVGSQETRTTGSTIPIARFSTRGRTLVRNLPFFRAARRLGARRTDPGGSR